jgi:UDP-N-acetylglucosamine 4,6-dehydratase
MNTWFDGKSVLVTGGTGSFGKKCVETLLNETTVAKVIILSRDELKQFEMQQVYPNEPRLRFFIGDVRDRDRLMRAFAGVNVVIHAAAMKHIPAAEYNPFEAVKTNIIGAQNVIDAAIDCGVERVVALSTDKASSPINLYGATKLVSDKLFVDGNAYAGGANTRFSVVRYGNVLGSRGSVVPLFHKQRETGRLTITDPNMTRFWITLRQGVALVFHALETMNGGEIFVPKIKSMSMPELAKAMAPEAKVDVIGMRPGEKLHEEMISEHDAYRTFDRGHYFVIVNDDRIEAEFAAGSKPVPKGFRYSSDKNDEWLGAEELHEMLED